MRDPRALIDTATLAAALGDPSLRVFDCTTVLDPAPAGSAEPYIAVPGRGGWGPLPSDPCVRRIRALGNDCGGSSWLKT